MDSNTDIVILAQLISALMLIVGGQCKSVLDLKSTAEEGFGKPIIQNDNCTVSVIGRIRLLEGLLSRINRKVQHTGQIPNPSQRNRTFVLGCGEEEEGYPDDPTPSFWPIAIGLIIFALAVGAVGLAVFVTKRKQDRQRLINVIY